MAVDDRTLIARSEIGFDVRTEAEVPRREPGANRGPVWLPLQPAELAVRGSQRISGAMVSIEARDGNRITALRYRFHRPLSEMVFIRFRGCSEAEPMVLKHGSAPSCGNGDGALGRQSRSASPPM
jgi:hypothetical protein